MMMVAAAATTTAAEATADDDNNYDLTGNVSTVNTIVDGAGSLSNTTLWSTAIFGFSTTENKSKYIFAI